MPKKSEQTQKTPKGYEIPVRDREAVLSDFRKVVGPPKGRNRPKK
jgi:hypothetical protein